MTASEPQNIFDDGAGDTLPYDAAAALTPDQAKRLERALTSKGIQAKAFGAANTTHGKINSDLGLPNDPSTTEVLSFLKSILR